jgi:predicted ATPase/class 3 adenylate cyclase
MTTHPSLPTGTVTFLFTDIEGSTRLWEAHPDAMRDALGVHDAIFRDVVPACGGAIFKTVGDAICAAFERADDAVRAAVAAQLRLAQQAWPGSIGSIRVRMGIHTGTAQERDDDYFGRTVNRVARFMSIAHGGQILVSGTAEALLRHAQLDDISLRDLGEHRLKDLSEPEPAFQVIAEGLATAFPSLSSLDAHPNNLPSQASSFVGRTAELAALAHALDDNRLVTLAGPGGIGKTRLALHCAADVIGRFKDGVWFVEFASLADPALIAQTVAGVLRIREVPHEALDASLMHALERKQLLLVFDNAEHLLHPVAALAKALVARCPHLRILATSREPLYLDGERVYRLLPLESDVESAALFLDRARSAKPDLALYDGDQERIVRICRRVEGIPLAIELAAARVALLGLAELDARLEQRFRVLVSRDRTRAERHRKLWETIDWSYRLLDAEERRFAAELAIFNGSFTLEACESILPHGDASLDLLESMVAKSIVAVHGGASGYRYVIYDAIREYLAEIMGASTLLHQRHFAYYAALGASGRDQSSPDLHGAWLESVGREIVELRAALSWAFENRHADGVQLLFDVSRFWDIRNHHAEGLDWVRRGLALADLPPAVRASLLRRAAMFAIARLENADAASLTQECLAAYEQIGDISGAGEALFDLGSIALRMGDEASAAENYWLALDKLRAGKNVRGEAMVLIHLTILAFNNADLDAAGEFLRKAAELAATIGDAHLDAHVTGFRASLEYRRGNLDAALQLNRETLAVRRALDNRFGIAEALARLTIIHLVRAEIAEARAAARESFAIALEIESPPLIIDGFEAFCEIALADRRFDDAARYFGTARFLRQRHQYDPGGLRDRSRIEGTIREAVGDRYELLAVADERSWKRDAAALAAS